MFSRVVSNFRRKSKANRKTLKSSAVSLPDPKINPGENRSGRNFILPEFDYDETFGATSLSVGDNECVSSQNKDLSLCVDKSNESSSGAINSLP